MDPLDQEYIHKYLSEGAPLKVEKLLELEVKPSSLKAASIIGALTVGVAGAAAAAYYWIKKNQEEEEAEEQENEQQQDEVMLGHYMSNYHRNDVGRQQQQQQQQPQENEEDDDAIITTTTTTTTTTSYISQPQPILQHKLPIQPPKIISHSLPPLKLIDDNGTPLEPAEQNKLILQENKVLKKDLDNLNHFVNEQMIHFDERLRKLETNDKKVRELESELDKERYCGICQENEKQVCWTNCGHRLCARCAIVIKSSVQSPCCPMCRRSVDQFVRCYNS